MTGIFRQPHRRAAQLAICALLVAGDVASVIARELRRDGVVR